MPELDITIAKGGQFRVFAQYQGSSPDNPYVYIGCLSLDGFQEDLGEGDPIYCPSSEVVGKFDIVDTTAPPPSLPTTDFTQHMDRRLNDFWWDLRKRGCRFNFAVKGTNCGRPDDPDEFDGKILVAGSKLTSFNTGAFNGLEEDAAIDLTGTLQLLSFDPFRPMTFGEVADSIVFSEVLDGVFADSIQCGDCGTPSDGCQRAYALTTTITGSPSLSSQVIYTGDRWGTSAADDVDSLAGQAGNAIAPVGSRIVVVSEVDEAHHHKLQSAIDAGTAGAWSRVAGGYVAGKGPRAIWSKSPSQTYIAAAGGYVYFMANPTAAVTVLSDGSATLQDLNDIRGMGSVIVAGGNSNALVVSRNRGNTWTALTGPSVGLDIQTVEVVTERIWFVGYLGGEAWYTTNGGESWTQFTPDSDIDDVYKIRFVNELVGYMIVQVGGGTRAYRTADNGYSWHYDGSYLAGLPTAEQYNFIVPCPGNYNVAFAGGAVVAAGDGILAVGVG